MTQDHLSALYAAAEAKKGEEGWMILPDGRSLTLYVAADGATLTVGRVQSLRLEGQLVHAKTNKGEHYIVALEDAYAGSVDAPSGVTKKAGFV
jgi:hypothetical protein